MVDTRAYTATRIRHLLRDQRQTGQAALPGPDAPAAGRPDPTGARRPGSGCTDGRRSRSGSSGSPARATSLWRADPRNRSGRCHQVRLSRTRRTQQNLPFVIRPSRKITSSASRPPAWTPGRSSAGSPGTAGPRSACSPTPTSPSRSPVQRPQDGQRRPGRRADPGHRPGAAAAPARHRHPAAPPRPGPPAALVGLATPPSVPRPPSPPALERLRRDSTMITTNYSCRRRSTATSFLPTMHASLCSSGDRGHRTDQPDRAGR